MRFFSFGLLIGGGAVLGHLYLYRLVRQLVPSRRGRIGAAAILLALTALLVFRGPIRDIGPTVARVYQLVAYSWIAVALCLVIALAVGDLVRLALWITHRVARPWRRTADGAAGSAPTEPRTAASSESAGAEGARTEPARAMVSRDRGRGSFDPSRRVFLARALPLTVLGGGLATAAHGSLRAFTPPEISEVPIALPRMPRPLDGLSIAQLTDVHVGPFLRSSFVDALVEETNALRPDLVVITGDLVDGDVRTLGPAVSRLGRLRSRYGTYFVTGNHEYYSGVTPWVRFLERLGVTVLRNQRVRIGDAGASVDLVGVDDWSGARRRGGQGYDLEAATAGRDPDRAAVLLAHQPVNFEGAVDRGVGLQISGHTHGGQIFPMTELVELAYPYDRGLFRHREGHLYVSRGCGFWGPPSRVGSPPEIVRYVLTA